MKFQSKVGERGQVVIPKPIRDTLGLDKNSAVEFELKGRTVMLKPKDDLVDFELALKRYGGSLRKQFLAKGYKSVDEYLNEMRGRDETRNP
jgi:AbrB family looped-hinge helix DNA binding protein